MKAIRISEDVVPIAQFKGEASRWLRHLSDSRQPVVITLNGKPAGVLLAPAEYDRLQERERFLESVAAGFNDAEAGRLMSTVELRKRLAARGRENKRP